MESVFSIQFANDTDTDLSDSIWIEAGDWAGDDNKVTYSDFYKFVSSRFVNMFNTDNPFDLVYLTAPTHDCGLTEDNEVTIPIYVYRLDRSLSYSLYSSYGEFSDKTVEEETYEEVISFNIENSYTLKYPVLDSFSYEWQDDVYDSDGNKINPPTVTLKDRELTLSKKVYGFLKITHRFVRDAYTLTVPGEDVVDDIFGGAVYALHKYGITYLVLDSPSAISEELLDGDVECGWQWSAVTFDFSGTEQTEEELMAGVPKYAPKVDTTINVNYCTGEVDNIEKNYV